MDECFTPSVTPPAGNREPALWLILCGTRMVVREDDQGVSLPVAARIEDLGIEPLSEQYLGSLGGLHVFAAEVPEAVSLPDGLRLNGVWGLFNHLDPVRFGLALRAVHIVSWNRNDRYCMRCGTANVPKDDERAKVCPACGLASFPRLSPAVIVLVEKGDEILLARSNRFKDALFSVLAGFVEPGETLEETVRREIREEAGIEVKDIRYFGSQHWPFPDSLMIAFTAQYAGGDLRIDTSEITEAGWFSVDNLPTIPGGISIARRMIDWFVAKKGKR